MLRLHILASGSRGNASVIEDAATGRAVLIDCGISKKDFMARCAEAAFDPATCDDSGEALYWQMARHANDMACRLASGLRAASYEPLLETTGNQQFFWQRTPS